MDHVCINVTEGVTIGFDNVSSRVTFIGNSDVVGGFTGSVGNTKGLLSSLKWVLKNFNLLDKGGRLQSGCCTVNNNQLWFNAYPLFVSFRPHKSGTEEIKDLLIRVIGIFEIITALTPESDLSLAQAELNKLRDQSLDDTVRAGWYGGKYDCSWYRGVITDIYGRRYTANKEQVVPFRGAKLTFNLGSSEMNLAFIDNDFSRAQELAVLDMLENPCSKGTRKITELPHLHTWITTRIEVNHLKAGVETHTSDYYTLTKVKAVSSETLSFRLNDSRAYDAFISLFHKASTRAKENVASNPPV